MTYLTSAALALALISNSAIVADESDSANYDIAQNCAAYTVILPSIMDDNPATIVQARRINEYWVERSLQYGKKLGYSGKQVEMSRLVIEIDGKKAREILIDCVQRTPDKVIEQ